MTRRLCWVVAVVVVLVVAGVAAAIAKPFSSIAKPVDSIDATGVYTVTRQDLSSQTQVPATLGYGGSVSVTAPSGTSAEDVAQAQQTVAEDQQTLATDERLESGQSTADNQAIAADQANVAADESTLKKDHDEQTVSQDQAQLIQAQQQLAAAESTAALDLDQNQGKVQIDQTKLGADAATLASLQATEANPGTTYTWLPGGGDVIREDQPVYSLSNEPVPLLYGSVPAYRAFYVGMSGGTDVGELTRDLIALGYSDGLAQTDDYSAATAAAVKRWQASLGLPATGEILLGEVVFEPGPIRVTSVTPTVGESVGSPTVLSAASTTRRISIALDVGQQSEVAVGDKVTVTLPNNAMTPSVISSVGTVATPSSTGSGPTVTVLVNPTDPAATGTWDQAPVTVTITTGSVTN
jgi:peptidoglycan hydrolase-like protein with peptidoglycan-binding domain